MKTIIIVLVAALLCGCSNKLQDQQIAALEQKRFELESRIGKMEQDLAQLQVFQKTQLGTNSILLSEADNARSTFTNMDSAINRLDDLVRSTASKFSAPYIAAAAKPKVVTTANGVPEPVYQQIAAAAAKDYPGDYSTQAYVIDNQIKAYKKLHP
jgi:outer membrane murein-binding lipoprotein Lpp